MNPPLLPNPGVLETHVVKMEVQEEIIEANMETLETQDKTKAQVKQEPEDNENQLTQDNLATQENQKTNEKSNLKEIKTDSHIELSQHIRESQLWLERLDKQLRAWLMLYLPFLLTLENTLSPYAHIFVYHMPEILRLHGNINLYNCQGLEKLNANQTTTYFRNTNRCLKDNAYLKQLVDYQNRQDFKHLNGSNRDLDFELNE